MNKRIYRNILKGFNCNPPIGQSTVIDFECLSGLQLPKEYIEFLMNTNGGEGFIGNTYVIFWKLEELESFNIEYEVYNYAQDIYLFGSDGGGEAFAFDQKVTPWSVIKVPFVGIDRKLCQIIAPDFYSFLKHLSNAK